MSKRVASVMGILILGAIIGSVVLWSMYVTDDPSRVSAEPSAEGRFVCTPVEAMVTDNRIHVRCLTSPGGGIVYFAAPLDEPSAQAFLVQIATALNSPAVVELVIYYFEDTTSGPPFGCAANDCRKIATLVSQLKPGAPLN